MEGIKKFFKENEETLWQYYDNHDDNLMEEILSGFYLSIIIILTGIIFPLILLIINNFDYLILNLILVSIFCGIGFFLGILSYLRMKNRCNTTNLTPSKLKHYRNIFILTNQRWIQKFYRNNVKINKSFYKKNKLEKKFDIVFINLNAIKTIVAEELKYKSENTEKKGAIVRLYITSSYEYSYKSKLGVNIYDWQKYEDLMRKLYEVLTLQKSEEVIDGPLGKILTFTHK